ncbi:ribonuclease H-like domain-containing protein [Melampsora americana]|nr:ribonuclease H-like domain-containing protein [Melampsora americana]
MDDAPLPDFQVQDPGWPAQTIYLCPSDNYSKIHLKRLLDEIVMDGIEIKGSSNPNDQSGSNSMKVIAFDMEWCHDWSRKCSRTTSLIQLAGQSKVLIIQLVQLDEKKWKETTFPQSLADLITSTEIIKIGAGIINDEQKIDQDIWIDSEDRIVKLKNYLEINDLVKKFDHSTQEDLRYKTYSLQKLVERYLNLHLPKSRNLTRSNWETNQLTSSQSHYAAADVVSVMRVYQRLMSTVTGDLNDVKPLLKGTEAPPRSDLPFADPPKKKKFKKRTKGPKISSINSTASGMSTGKSSGSQNVW